MAFKRKLFLLSCKIQIKIFYQGNWVNAIVMVLFRFFAGHVKNRQCCGWGSFVMTIGWGVGSVGMISAFSWKNYIKYGII